MGVAGGWVFHCTERYWYHIWPFFATIMLQIWSYKRRRNLMFHMYLALDIQPKVGRLCMLHFSFWRECTFKFPDLVPSFFFFFPCFLKRTFYLSFCVPLSSSWLILVLDILPLCVNLYLDMRMVLFISFGPWEVFSCTIPKLAKQNSQKYIA